MILLYFVQVTRTFFSAKWSVRIAAIMSFFLCLFYSIWYSLDLNFNWGREVWWSDAEYYLMLDAKKVSYFSYASFVQGLKNFGFGVFGIRLVNVVLSIAALINLSRAAGIKRINYYVLIVVYLNPFWMLSLGRVLKDALFLYLVSVVILVFVRKPKLATVASPLFSVLLAALRPWAVVLPYVFILVYIGSKLRGLQRVMMVVLLLTLTIALVDFEHILFWIKYINTGRLESYSLSWANRFLGLFKIFLSPGWYRLFRPEEYFVYWTLPMLTSVGIGLLLNFWVFSRIIFSTVGRSKSIGEKLIYVYVGLATAVYAYSYAGSVEFRIKSVIVIPLLLLVSSFSSRKIYMGFQLLIFFTSIVIFTAYGF